MKLWIKKNDDNEPLEKISVTGPEIEPKRGWQRVFGGVILCAMLVPVAVTIYGYANGKFQEKSPTEVVLPSGDTEAVDGQMFSGMNAGETARKYPYTLADVLNAYSEKPILELLQKNCIPYVYDDEGKEIALFKVDGIVTDQSNVAFDQLRLTDSCVASCSPLNEIELPETVYADAAKTTRLVMFNNSLYWLTADDAGNISSDPYYDGRLLGVVNA